MHLPRRRQKQKYRQRKDAVHTRPPQLPQKRPRHWRLLASLDGSQLDAPPAAIRRAAATTASTSKRGVAVLFPLRLLHAQGQPPPRQQTSEVVAPPGVPPPQRASWGDGWCWA